MFVKLERLTQQPPEEPEWNTSNLTMLSSSKTSELLQIKNNITGIEWNKQWTKNELYIRWSKIGHTGVVKEAADRIPIVFCMELITWFTFCFESSTEVNADVSLMTDPLPPLPPVPAAEDAFWAKSITSFHFPNTLELWNACFATIQYKRVGNFPQHCYNSLPSYISIQIYQNYSLHAANQSTRTLTKTALIKSRKS